MISMDGPLKQCTIDYAILQTPFHRTTFFLGIRPLPDSYAGDTHVSETTLNLLIQQIRLEGEGTTSFDLVFADERKLPPFAAGAHVNVQIPGGLRRSYSLVNTPSDRTRYRIAVKREPDSLGGSAWLHEKARVGMALQVSLPLNDMTLVEEAPLSVFIAGGIGITPMLSMIERLVELGRPWQLHYSARTPRQMAFRQALKELEANGLGQVHLHFTGDGEGRLDINQIAHNAPPDAHLYACGPASLIDGFITATQARHPKTAHYERFSAAQEAATTGGFELQLLRDGRTLQVPEGKSILDVLLDANVNVEYACTQGVCGTCRVGVKGGVPDHRDDCLSDEEKAANDTIITCCSGSRSATLVLDL